MGGMDYKYSIKGYGSLLKVNLSLAIENMHTHDPETRETYSLSQRI